MKKNFAFLLVFVSLLSFTQQKETRLKFNGLFLPVGIINVGAEREINEKWSMQADVLISPWKSFANNHFQIYMGHLEVRRYFKQVMNGWYIGANIGGSVFDITKWNYWNKGKYQRGFNYMIGGVVGYQFPINRNWNVDFFLGGGVSQGFYHGYSSEEPYGRYENATWNKSGEWIPYRGGISFSYKILP